MNKLLFLLFLIFPFSTSASPNFGDMTCTQAIAWASSQIISQQPPGTLPLAWKKGDAETTAIQILHAIPNSPCASKFLVNRYGFEPAAQSEKR